MDIINKSYNLHEEHYSESAHSIAEKYLNEGTIYAWLHERLHNSISPLIEMYPNATWVTIGDGRYGNDARFIKQKGVRVLATDISDGLLKKTKGLKLIECYKKENAECLSFKDMQFDYVLCKEAFHHFPRPFIALYEMIRIARMGVVLIEPNDHKINNSMLQFFSLCKEISHKNDKKRTFN